MADYGAEKERAKRIILEIVRQAGGTFYNKTNLYKAFWKAHLSFAKNNPGYLTDWPIVKMPQGPGIHQFDPMMGELMMEGLFKTEQADDEYAGFVFTTKGCVQPESELNQQEIDAIREGLEFVKNKYATDVSYDSHQKSHSWREANLGDELNIYVDLLSEEEYEAKKKKMELLSDAFERGFSRTN